MQFTTLGASASEGAGSVSINVLRTGSDESPVTIDFATSDGTARAGANYTPLPARSPSARASD